jgi:hypothetical protein
LPRLPKPRARRKKYDAFSQDHPHLTRMRGKCTRISPHLLPPGSRILGLMPGPGDAVPGSAGLFRACYRYRWHAGPPRDKTARLGQMGGLRYHMLVHRLDRGGGRSCRFSNLGVHLHPRPFPVSSRCPSDCPGGLVTGCWCRRQPVGAGHLFQARAECFRRLALAAHRRTWKDCISVCCFKPVQVIYWFERLPAAGTGEACRSLHPAEVKAQARRYPRVCGVLTGWMTGWRPVTLVAGVILYSVHALHAARDTALKSRAGRSALSGQPDLKRMSSG